jgi:O-antigen/teichoic acid export membrane protein
MLGPRIWGNTLATVLSVLIPGLLGLWSLKPLMSLLGPVSFTMLSFFWVYASHMGFFDLGISRNLAIELPKSAIQHQALWVHQAFRKGLQYAGWGMLMVGLLFWAVIVFQPQFVWLSDPKIWTLLLFWVPLSVGQMIVRGILESLNFFVAAAFFRGYNQLVLFLIPWMMAFWGYVDFFSVILVMTLFRVASLLPALVWIENAFGIFSRKWVIDKSVVVHQNNQWLTLSNLSGIVNGSLDRFVLLSILGTQALATYVFTQDFTVRILVLSSSFSLVLLPFFSRNNNKTQNHAWVLRGMGLIVMVHAMLAIVLFSGDLGLLKSYTPLLWTGEGSVFLGIFLIGITANGMGHVLLSALHSHRVLKQPAIWHGISAIVYIPVLYWVVSEFGLLGAAILWSGRSVIDTLVLYLLWR